jgi:hypothetical protein
MKLIKVQQSSVFKTYLIIISITLNIGVFGWNNVI